MPTKTSTVTQTPTKTSTSTFTPTRTLLPTLTPAKAQVDSDVYDLKEWSPELADYMALLMQDFPDTLSGIYDQAYFDAYKYAIKAQQEAILRYPDSHYADRWRWDLSYNMARTGNPLAGKHYADLIARGLNRGEVEISHLYGWLPVKAPGMGLYMIEFDPPPGYLASYLLEVRGAGSAFIWLLEKSGGYQAYSLLSRFDFVHQPSANWIVSDLDGDINHRDELAIYFSNLADEFELNPPHVFGLDQIPQNEMPFNKEASLFNIGTSFDNYWVVRPNSGGSNDLVFKSTVFPSCPVTIQFGYRWNGLYFDLSETSFRVEGEFVPSSYCGRVVDHAANVWGPAAAISIMETLLPYWPPKLDEEGAPYPADVTDEWHYRLGVYYALLGEPGIAKNYFTEAITNPAVFNSRWITPSKAFLSTYQSPEDIYISCIEAMYCDPAYAIHYLVENMPPGADALQYLQEMGVATDSTGYIDFDGDDEPERWFTVRHQPREKLEFWLLAKYGGGTKALYVSDIDASPPSLEIVGEDYIDENGLHLQPATLLDGRVAFTMVRTPDFSHEPFLESVPLRAEYPNRFFDLLEAASKALIEGVSPEIVQEELINLKKYPGLLCEPTWSCDSYYYLLGLSSELAGDDRSAVEAYHYLWLNYSKSPFATMGRLKLSGLPFYTATPTPTITPTGTTTPTQTTSPTLTTTGTPPTATNTPTHTSTTDSYPGAATPTQTTPSPYPGPATQTPITASPYP